MLQYGVLGFFLLIMILVGFISYRKVQTSEDYVLGGRKIGPWLSAFSYGTTYFSAVVFVGYAGRFGWQFGLSATWIGIGNAIIGSLVAWLLLAERTRRIRQVLSKLSMSSCWVLYPIFLMYLKLCSLRRSSTFYRKNYMR